MLRLIRYGKKWRFATVAQWTMFIIAFDHAIFSSANKDYSVFNHQDFLYNTIPWNGYPLKQMRGDGRVVVECRLKFWSLNGSFKESFTDSHTA